MRIVRGLLTAGNSKTGQSLHVWSLPAGQTCPGKTQTCYSHCYARKSRFRFKGVKERSAWNLKQAQADDFVDRMVAEIKRKGVLVLRVHAAGDFFTAAYAEKWLAIIKQFPKVRFYAYTRSHTIPEIATVLEQMAALPQMQLWYSLDSDMTIPTKVPPRVRLAYLQVTGKEAAQVDLFFRVRMLRKTKPERLELPVMTCPNELPGGEDVTCASCANCWSEK